MKNKMRELNFEILRIVSMLMILILHFNKYGLILESVEVNSVEYFIFNFLEYASVIAVNIYVLITGYFMINKNINKKRIISLELEILFYSIGIYLILLLARAVPFNLKDGIKMILPTLSGSYWFMSAYMLLYLLIPFINNIISKMKQKDYRNLLIILTLLLSIVASYLPIKSIININNGYSLIWFIYLYMLGGYIKLHKINILENIKKWVLIVLYLLIIGLELGILIIYNNQVDHNTTLMFLEYNTPLVLLSSMIFFYIFKNIKINNTRKYFILTLSKSTLAVYLVHMHSIFRDILWTKILNPLRYLGTYQIYLALIIDVILVFFISILIEQVRIFMPELLYKSANFLKKQREKLES